MDFKPVPMGREQGTGRFYPLTDGFSGLESGEKKVM